MSFKKIQQKKIALRTKRRGFRVKNKLVSTGLKPRISVYRSLNQIYAQIIDDTTHTTMVSYSSLLLKDEQGDKKAIAKKVGLELGKLAITKDIKDVFFDRGAHLYHGRVSALADGLRESGLQF